jgi:hypothetical protein
MRVAFAGRFVWGRKVAELKIEQLFVESPGASVPSGSGHAHQRVLFICAWESDNLTGGVCWQWD